MNQAFIKFSIQWGPTILFVSGLLFAILIGWLKGLRKSALTVVHAVISAGICIILFFSLVNNKGFDAFLLKTTNAIIPGTIQELLGVSSECTTFREVIHEYLPKSVDMMNGISLIIKDNGAYLDSLVDMAYRIIFGLVLFLIYWILLFLIWLFTILIMPDHRYKKRRNKNYMEGKVDTPFQKRRWAGAIVEGCRNLVEGVVFLSFLGTLFFIFGGGIGDKNEPDYTFDMQEANIAYGSYQAIGSYGTTGIYKVLNLVKDPSDVPYYLFAADLIFQGGLTDPEKNIRQSVYFREELAAYVSLSRDTFDLVLKYGSEDLNKVLNGEYEGDAMTVIMTLFANESFQEEFRKVITTFDSKTYFMNLALSLVDSFMSHIDSFDEELGIPSDTSEIIRILFQKGYLSPSIPYEAELISQHSEIELGYIRASQLFTKDDIFTAYDLFIDYVKAIHSGKEDMDMVLGMIQDMIPHIQQLSILNTTRSNELNPVLKRLYAYVDANYLAEDSYILASSTHYNAPYMNTSYDSIDWIAELKLFVDCVADGYDIFLDVYDEDKEVYEMLFDIFDPNRENVTENEIKFNNVLNTLSDSHILGEVLSSSAIMTGLIEGLSEIASNPYIPELEFSNVYDSDGRLVEHGELYNILCGVRAFTSDRDNLELLETLEYGEFEDEAEALDMVRDLIAAIENPDKYTSTSIEYRLLDSKLLRSILTGFVTETIDFGDVQLYVDDSTLEHDSNGKAVPIFEKQEGRAFFTYLPDLLNVVELLLTNDSEEAVYDLMKNDIVYDMLDSKIIEGTISSILVEFLKGDDMIIIPASLKKHQNMVTTSTEESEVRKLLGLRKKGVDISVFMETYADETEQSNEILSFIKSLDDAKRASLFDSKILWYSISNYLVNGSDGSLGSLPLVVPESSLSTLEKDTIPSIILKKDIIDLFKNISMFLPEEDQEMNTSTMITNLIRNREPLNNIIIMATLINSLVNDPDVAEELGDALVIPQMYRDAGQPDILREKLNRQNIWYKEIHHFLDALDCVFGVTKENKQVVLDDTVSDIVAEGFKTYNDIYSDDKTKLTYIYSSDIFVATLSRDLDEMFRSSNVSESAIEASKVKGTDSYTFKDMQALVDTCVIYDIDLSDDTDFSIVEDKVLETFPQMSTRKSTNREGKSDLDLIYESAIVREEFSKSVDSMNIVEKNADSVLKDNYNTYYKVEIENLIDLINILGIDDVTDTELISKKVNQNILVLLDKPTVVNTNVATNIEYLYLQKMSPCVLTKSIKDNTDVPLDAYAVTGTIRAPYVTCIESKTVLQVMKDLDVTLDGFSLKHIDMEKVNPEGFSKSTIVSASFYNEIKTSKDLIIPNHVLNSGYSEGNTYIQKEEFKKFLIELKAYKDTFFTKDIDGKYDISTVSFEMDDVTTVFLADMSKSRIFEASTILKMMEDDGVEIYSPDRYATGALKNNLIEKEANPWYETDELYHLAMALDVLKLKDDKVNNLTSDVFESFMLEDKINQKNEENVDNSAIMYNSYVFAATMSYHVEESFDKDLINPNNLKNALYYVYMDSAYTRDEMCSLSTAYKEIRNKSGNKDFDMSSEITPAIILRCDREILYKSYLMKAFMTKGIVDETKATDAALVDTPLAYLTNTEIYNESEMDSVLNLLDENGSYDDISFGDTMTLKTLIGIIKFDEKNNCITNLMVQSISKDLLSDAQVIVPEKDYESRYHRILPESLLAFLVGLDTFSTASSDTMTMDFVLDDVIIPTDELKIEKIVASNMLRATITNNISVEDSGGAISGTYVEKDYSVYSPAKDYQNNPISILTADEMRREFWSANLLFDGKLTGTVEFAKLKEIYLSEADHHSFNKLLDSSLIYVSISEFLSKGIKIGGKTYDCDADFSISKNTTEVFDIHAFTTKTLKLMNRTAISMFMGEIVAL